MPLYSIHQVDISFIGLSHKDALESPYIASMRVYVFKTDVLPKLLEWRYPTANDFGSEIIPAVVREHNVQVREIENNKITYATAHHSCCTVTMATIQWNIDD